MAASQFPPLQSKPSAKHCPNCSAKMAAYTLPGHYGSSVEIDVCMDCNAIWFDQLESSMLSPDGTVALFQLIHERGGAATDAARKFSEGLRCATCRDSMRLTNDIIRNTRFTYQACRHGHGRLTTFYNFLAEKQFVRELTRAERAKLAVTVQQIRCSGCGAPVDIGKVDACVYCRAPVSVFDREAAKKAIDHYLQERQKQPAAARGATQDRREAPRGGDRWSNYDRVDLGSDILYALGRVAARGIGGAGRSAPAVGGAVGGAASGAMADSTLETFPDATTAMFGGAAASSASTASGAANTLADALPSATDALFAGTVAGSASMPESAAGALSDALPSAADALFGSASSAAGDAGTSLGGEIASVFSDAASSGVSDTVADVASSIAGDTLESVAEGGAGLAGELASSAGEGVIDLVTEGIGSLLGSLFS